MAEEIRVQIRWVIRRDIPDVLAIEEASFEYEGWTEEDFLRCLRQGHVIGMVAENSERVLGYMIYELRAHEIVVLNFAVHPDYRRHSIGRKMVEKLQSKLSRHRRRSIALEVRESNLDAQLFFRSQGFVALGIKHGAYDEEDGILMEYRFAEESALANSAGAEEAE